MTVKKHWENHPPTDEPRHVNGSGLDHTKPV